MGLDAYPLSIYHEVSYLQLPADVVLELSFREQLHTQLAAHLLWTVLGLGPILRTLLLDRE